MKKSSFICNYQTYIISDDGSIVYINLPHKKKPVQSLIDLSNNPLFASPVPIVKIELEVLLETNSLLLEI